MGKTWKEILENYELEAARHLNIKETVALRHAIAEAFEAVKVEVREVKRGVYQEYDKGYNHAVGDSHYNAAAFLENKLMGGE